MQGRLNPHWCTTPRSIFPTPSLGRSNSPPPPPGFDSLSLPPPPPGFSYHNHPRHLFSARPPPILYFPADPNPPQLVNRPDWAPPVSGDRIERGNRTAVSSAVLLSPEMRTTRSSGRSFQPISLPPLTRGRDRTSGSGGRHNKSSPASQSLGGGSRARATPAPKTPDLQVDKGIDKGNHIQQFTPRQKLSESTMEEGEIREYSKPSKKPEIGSSSIADYNDQVSGLKKSAPGKAEALKDNDTSVMDDTSNTATERQETSVKELLQMLLTKRTELEAAKAADSQLQARPILKEQLVPAKKQSDQMTNMDASSAVEGGGTSEGDIRHGELQEVSSSVRIEAEAPILAGFQKEMQAQESTKSLPPPGRAESSKRRKEQVDTMEGSSSQERDGRERKLQKLASVEKDEVDIAKYPISQKTPSFHDQTDSCSLSNSSILNLASAFGDVSSPGGNYWMNDQTGVIKVGSYFVHQKHSSTLDAILQKHGDIAKDCDNSSIIIRSHLVQGICEVVEGIQIPLEKLKYEYLKTYSRFVKEAVKMGVSVRWLEERLDQVSQSIDSIKQYKFFKDAREANTGKIEDLKVEIGLNGIEKRRGEHKVEELESFVKTKIMELKKKRRAINDIKARCKALPKRLLGGLYEF